MNRTEFIGTDLYYSQEFVDDLTDKAILIHQFNQDLTELNIKYSEELEVLRKQKKDSVEFIDRYLLLNLDDFNASSLLKKLREILTRGDDYPKEE